MITSKGVLDLYIQLAAYLTVYICGEISVQYSTDIYIQPYIGLVYNRTNLYDFIYRFTFSYHRDHRVSSHKT